MNDGLSDDIKKMLPLTIELQDHKEKVFHNVPVSPTFHEKMFSTQGRHLDIFHFSATKLLKKKS